MKRKLAYCKSECVTTQYDHRLSLGYFVGSILKITWMKSTYVHQPINGHKFQKVLITQNVKCMLSGDRDIHFNIFLFDLRTLGMDDICGI